MSNQLIYLAVVSEDNGKITLGILPCWLLTFCFGALSVLNLPVTGILLGAISTLFVSLTLASILVNAIIWAIWET